MTTFQLVPAGPFSLGASAAFLEGFSPAAYRGAGDGHLHVAFVPDGEAEAAGVGLREPGGGGGGGGWGGYGRWTSTAPGSRRWPRGTRWSPVCRRAGRDCGRSGSSHRTRPPP